METEERSGSITAARHNSIYFFSSLIFLLLPAFAASFVAASRHPRANMRTEVGECTSRHVGIALIGSPPSPLVPKRPSFWKSFILNSACPENRWYPRGFSCGPEAGIRVPPTGAAERGNWA
jgi:hypothetical protein